ncbi:MAG TPA: gamma-glutamyltransferase [Anaerolineales bacterium]|nr:gamma-glutamyltransferase [Anaerolineales bacterium]
MSEFSFSSNRSTIYAKRGIVAASQPLAVAAGLEILSHGGNAADAAIATAAALNVTEPTSTGIGGDCFALYFEAKTANVYALNGSGRAPAALTLERLKQEGYTDQLPIFHPYTITVPGACAGWCDLIERFGNLSMGDILSPAIRLAEDGFPVAPITAHFWQRGALNQLKTAPGGQELTIDGRGPFAGEIFRNPGLARTLQLVAEQGKLGFYQGALAEAIAAVVQSAGGCLTVDDLASHHSTWEEPILTNYRGVNIWECPPNGQGLTALLALNILEGFNLADLPALSHERLHLMIEALRLAFADTRWFVADPAFSHIPLKELLSKSYAQERRKKIDLTRATVDQEHGYPFSSSDTVYLSVVDGQGNACSFINSNYRGFGTGIVPKGWGFTLQNRGHNFSLQPGHPNALEPGKRPYHTIIPALATRTILDTSSNNQTKEQLFASFGVMGGFMQPQGHVQVVVNIVDDGLDPQEALDRPRFCIEDGTSGGVVAVEEGIPEEVIGKLADMGHSLRHTSGHDRAIFGRGQIIRRDASTGVLCAGSDPRADGCAMTW